MAKDLTFKVESYTPVNQFIKNKNGLYECVGTVSLFGIASGPFPPRRVVFVIKPGFICDGLSVPKIFQWFLPAWDKKNVLYNLAGVIHDGLYATKGFSTFSREECDAIFRSILRDSGISRFKAGCADKAVEWFASGENHWGNDPQWNSHYFQMII